MDKIIILSIFIRDLYTNQHQIDMGSFLHARAQEFMGKMVLEYPYTCYGMIFELEVLAGEDIELLGFCFIDMAKGE